MDRRLFLGTLFGGIAAATVAAKLPTKTTPIVDLIKPLPPPNTYLNAPHGLSYLINDETRFYRPLQELNTK